MAIPRHPIAIVLLAIASALLSSGCGSTRWSDTQRTATEQLLISDAIDRAVSELDVGALADRKVYLETTSVRQTVDWPYLVSTVRQHLLAQGCILVDKLEDADYVVELRAGAVGTDRSDLLFGIPATKLPQSVPVQGVPNAIPELALATKTEQRAVAKIAVFAYNRHTGKLVWQSGVIPVESKIQNLWVLGAGPFKQGSIYQTRESAGHKVRVPFSGKPSRQWQPSIPSVAREMHYVDTEPRLADRRDYGKSASSSKDNKASAGGEARQAGHSNEGGTSLRTASPAPSVPPPPPVPPGPVGVSKHKGFGRTLDLTILDHMRISSAAAEHHSSQSSQNTAQPAVAPVAQPAAASPPTAQAVQPANASSSSGTTANTPAGPELPALPPSN